MTKKLNIILITLLLILTVVGLVLSIKQSKRLDNIETLFSDLRIEEIELCE
jgi:hypothetical protein